MPWKFDNQGFPFTGQLVWQHTCFYLGAKAQEEKLCNSRGEILHGVVQMGLLSSSVAPGRKGTPGFFCQQRCFSSWFC